MSRIVKCYGCFDHYERMDVSEKIPNDRGFYTIYSTGIRYVELKKDLKEIEVSGEYFKCKACATAFPGPHSILNISWG